MPVPDAGIARMLKLWRLEERSNSLAIPLLVVVLIGGKFSLAGDSGAASTLMTAVRTWGTLGAIIAIIGARALRPSESCSLQTRQFIALVSLLFGFLALSSLWGTPRAFPAVEVLDVLLVAVLVYCAAALVSRNPEVAVARLFICLLGISLVYLLGALAGIGRVDPERLSAFGGGPNVFVRIMATGAISALFVSAKTGRLRWVGLVPPLLVGAVLSGSRGGTLAVVLVLPLSLAMLRKRVPPRAWRRGLLVVSVCSALLFLLPLRSQTTTFVSDRYLELTFRDRYASGRDVLFEAAADMYVRNPVAGAGVGSFAVVTNSQENPYPHNLVLDFASAGGTIAVGLMAGVIGFTVRAGARARNGPLLTEAAFCGLAAAYHFLASQFSGGVFDSRFVWVFAGAVVVADVGRRTARGNHEMLAAAAVTA